MADMEMLSPALSDGMEVEDDDGDLGAPAPINEGLNLQMMAGVSFAMTPNYRLIKPVGKGAYGLVVSAADRRPGRGDFSSSSSASDSFAATASASAFCVVSRAPRSSSPISASRAARARAL